MKFYRKKIRRWRDKTVWFYTTNLKREHESVARYKEMSLDDLPTEVQKCYEDNVAIAVIQDYNTGEILEVYNG